MKSGHYQVNDLFSSGSPIRCQCCHSQTSEQRPLPSKLSTNIPFPSRRSTVPRRVVCAVQLTMARLSEVWARIAKFIALSCCWVASARQNAWNSVPGTGSANGVSRYLQSTVNSLTNSSGSCFSQERLYEASHDSSSFQVIGVTPPSGRRLEFRVATYSGQFRFLQVPCAHRRSACAIMRSAGDGQIDNHVRWHAPCGAHRAQKLPARQRWRRRRSHCER